MRKLWRVPNIELIVEETASTTAENAARTLPLCSAGRGTCSRRLRTAASLSRAFSSGGCTTAQDRNSLPRSARRPTPALWRGTCALRSSRVSFVRRRLSSTARERHRRLHPRVERGAEPSGRPRRAPRRVCRERCPRRRRRLDGRTADVARAHGAEVLSLGQPRPQVGIAAGYRWALDHGYAFCGRVDADGQHPARELARLLALVREDSCDVAVGSRFVSGDGYAPYRYLPSRQGGSARRCFAARWGSCCDVRSGTRPAGCTRSTQKRCRCSPSLSRAGTRGRGAHPHHRRRTSSRRGSGRRWTSARAASRSSGIKAVRLVLTVAGNARRGEVDPGATAAIASPDHGPGHTNPAGAAVSRGVPVVPRARSREPDGRPHGLQRRARAPDRDRARVRRCACDARDDRRRSRCSHSTRSKTTGRATSTPFERCSRRLEASTACCAPSVRRASGLSSSAALEVAVALALGGGELRARVELALACQQAEHRATGVPSGVMDQLASVAARADHALLIDCRSLELRHVPIPADAAIVVVHSGVPRTLERSAYADGRAACERIARGSGCAHCATRRSTRWRTSRSAGTSSPRTPVSSRLQRRSSAASSGWSAS